MTACTPAGRECILCGAATDGLGIFRPNDSQRWGAPPGKVRLIAYPLCGRHERTPDTIAEVEEIVYSSMGLTA